MRLVFAIAVISALNVLAHLALYDRLVRRPQWPRRARRLCAGLFVGMAVLVPVALVGGRIWPREVARPLVLLSSSWMGVLLFMGLAAAMAEALYWIAWGWRRWGSSVSSLRRTDPDGAPNPDPAARAAADGLASPDRRQMLVRSLAGGAALTGGAASLVALRAGFDLTFPVVEVKIPRLPPSLEGLTVVQLSDVHIGPVLGAPWLAPIVDKVNGLKPDLVVITGDLVDGSVRQLSEHVAPLGRLKARFGKYFVTGNHDFYSGADPWCAHLRQLGFRVLRNEIDAVGDGGGAIQLVGIDDYYTTGGLSVGRRLAPRIDRDRSSILLAHQPRSIGDAEAMGVDLQISGHTHGGQIYPVAELVRITTPYVAGLYRHDAQTQIYVSRGTGFVGPPMRFAAPAEVTRLVLTRA